MTSVLQRVKYVYLAVLGLLILPSMSQGGVFFNVTMDTSPLIGHPAGPFYIDFQLTDGSGSGDGNNTVTISGFNFGAGGGFPAGGTPLSQPVGVNPGTGDLSSSVILTDTAFLSEFTQEFTAGSSFSFDVSLTTNVDTGGTPDAFAFAILDSGLSAIPTLSFFDVFMEIDIDSATPTIHTYASDPTRSPAAGGRPIDIPVPAVTPLQQGAVPEPTSLLIFGPGALGFVACRWLRRRRAG